MNMRGWLVATAVCGLMIARPAGAVEITELKGSYEDGNVVRVIARVRMPAPPASAFRVAMLKAATMAGQKGFTRLALVKIDDCVSIGINSSVPIVQMCKVFGQMLHVGETAVPRSKEPVRYFTLQKRDDGAFIPVLENSLP
jgi:hypothetical protein